MTRAARFSILSKALSCSVLVLLQVCSSLAQTQEASIDKLFAAYQGLSPGCAVGVSQGGKVLLSKAYGIADLEHSVPLTTKSLFYMASVSKQFAAMSVLMLADEGKIRIEDSIRKTIPELPEYAADITLYHLLTHTSGVRDYLTLGSVAGRPGIFTDDSTLRLLSRQKALNFPPGSEFLYSNSGYVLLSLVVKRTTQKNLDAFAREKIFAPLEMTSTRFQHDYSALIPGKVNGYERRAGAWYVSNSLLSVVGDGGLYSSVEDMLRWADNFDSGKVGAKQLVTMSTAGKLSNGKEIPYGMGLVPSTYRGLSILEHTGALAGYRTSFLRFPSERLSVVCLCNSGAANAGQLARRVAEEFLASKITTTATVTAPAARPAVAITPSLEDVRSKVGIFRSDAIGYVEFTEVNGKLSGNGIPELFAMEPHRYVSADGGELLFDSQNPARTLELRLPGQSPIHFERVTVTELSETEMRAYTGDFDSDELNSSARVYIDSDRLSLQIGEGPVIRLVPAGTDRMRAANGAEFVFQRDSSGKVAVFLLSAGRIRNISFQRK